MSFQFFIVILAVILSVAYVIYRAWSAFHKASDPCHGCPGCALKDKVMAQGHKKELKALKKNIQKGLKPSCDDLVPPCMTLHNDTAQPCKEKK